MARSSTPKRGKPRGLPKEGDRDGEFVFRAAPAQRAVRFFALLRHVEGEWAGQPFVLEGWQYAFVWKVFGWRRKDGTRRYRRAYCEIPRKNGKSTFGAGLTLLLLLDDDEPGAQIYGAAESRDQASIIFRIAAAMVYSSPALAKLFREKRIEVLPSTRTIAVPRTNSFYRAIPADAPTAHGINAHGIVFDELHTQPNRDLYDVLTTSQGARRQPLTFMFTTAGYDAKSLCGQEHEYAQKVLAGVIDDPTYFAVIYAADAGDDILAEATWRKANPSYDLAGETFKANMRFQAKRAHDSPAFENTFRRLHLNQWTKQDVRWMPLSAWDACNGIVVEASLKGRRAKAGLDLASVTDIAAFVAVFPPNADEKRGRVLCRFWVPEENIEKRERIDGVPYRLWVDQGWMKATPGNAIDFGVIREDILKLAKDYQFEEVIFDRWGATQVTQELEAEGLNVRPFGQGFRDMNAPTKELMRLVLAHEIEHGGNPVLRWMADNLVVVTDPAGNLKPAKDKSKEKIDGIVALIMAVDGLMRDTGEVRMSFIG